MLCLGPTFSSTPMISTLNSSIRVPSNTVRPMPFMPGRTWSSGIDLHGCAAVAEQDGQEQGDRTG